MLMFLGPHLEKVRFKKSKTPRLNLVTLELRKTKYIVPKFIFNFNKFQKIL